MNVRGGVEKLTENHENLKNLIIPDEKPHTHGDGRLSSLELNFVPFSLSSL